MPRPRSTDLRRVEAGSVAESEKDALIPWKGIRGPRPGMPRHDLMRSAVRGVEGDEQGVKQGGERALLAFAQTGEQFPFAAQ